MYFENISPFVRYARYMELNDQFGYPEYYPLDNRIFYVCEGNSAVQTSENIFEMSPGSLLVIHAGCKYELRPGNVKYLAINFDYTDAGKTMSVPIPPVTSLNADFNSLNLTENVFFEDFAELNSYYFVRQTFSVKNLLMNIVSEYNDRLQFFEANTSSMLTSVLIQLFRHSKNQIYGTNLSTITDIAAYIHEHYNKPITNDELAELYNFHPNYLSSMFKKNFGKSLHQYVLDIRISNAISLLEEGKLDISQIASETGFSDSNYFSRYFKKVTGMSPKHYKR